MASNSDTRFQAPSDPVRAAIAAGPLENLLCLHGPTIIERALELAQKEYSFRRLLRGVWGWSRMPKDIRARIDDAVKAVPNW